MSSIQLKAPKDPIQTQNGFYILKNTLMEVVEVEPGRSIGEFYLSDGRIENAAEILGGVKKQEILAKLGTLQGFKELIHAIGVSIEITEFVNGMQSQEPVQFECMVYGKIDPYKSGTHIQMSVDPTGVEHRVSLEEVTWSEDDDRVGKLVFQFPKEVSLAAVDVKLYFKSNIECPIEVEEFEVDQSSEPYHEMIQNSLIQYGNYHKIKEIVDRIKRNDPVSIAFIGGSITQGAGAVPSSKNCYAYRTFCGIRDAFTNDSADHIEFIKAGIGGTSSELGVVRYDKDVLKFGARTPDLVIVEYAVNDEGDETNGDCYEGLIRKILNAPNQPAVILLFSVFAHDYNLQERMIPIGQAYQLPMVSIKNAVTNQFYLSNEQGRIVTKGQFFYDMFHPSNLGHQMMADCLLNLLKGIDQISIPCRSTDFEKIKYFDRARVPEHIQIDCGDFDESDNDLQYIELDDQTTPTKMFSDNWMYQGAKTDRTTFKMQINCRLLVMLPKDSGQIEFGKAEIKVDGKTACIYDSREVGWTHSNAKIVLREQKSEIHEVEISMVKGEEDLCFTILGFGYVDED